MYTTLFDMIIDIPLRCGLWLKALVQQHHTFITMTWGLGLDQAANL